MGSSSVTGKRIGADVGPCHTYRFHLIPVKSARQKRLEWQSSRLAPFGTKQELILTATTHTPLSHSLRQERKRQTQRERGRETHTEGREKHRRKRGGGKRLVTHAQITQLNKGFYTQRHKRGGGRGEQ